MAVTHAAILGIGGLLLAIPVVLHLLMQPRPRPLVFPALRFVEEIQRTSRRRLQLRHWVLLLLRCLVLAAVVAAFARPSTTSAAFGDWLQMGTGGLLSILCGLVFVYAVFFSRPANVPLALIVGAVLALLLAWTGVSAAAAFGKSSGHVLANRLAPIAAAVVVDSSPRMEYRHQNSTLLQRAREEGSWLIEQLPSESQVAVMQNNGQPPFFSIDVGAAQKRIKTLESSFAGVTIPETIESAVRFLRDSELQRKEIYVLSDLTRAGWTTAGNTLRQLLSGHPEISLYVIDVGVKEPTNLSLDQLELAGATVPRRGALTTTARLQAVGPGASIVARLVLEKPDPARPVLRDGKILVPEDHWVRPETVTVADNSSTLITMSLRDDFEPGVHHGWIELESSDSLDIDNRQYFTIEVAPAWRVLVVHPDNVGPGVLVDALLPIGNDGSGLYDVTVVSQEDFAEEFLEDYGAIFLLDPAPLSDAMWRILSDWVGGGGGLGIFPGQNAARGSEAEASFRSDAAASVLPGRLERVWRARRGPDGQSDLFLAPDTLTHPVLKEFRPYESLGIWQPFPIHLHWGVEKTGDATVEILARFSNGEPALLQRRLGQGQVICLTTPITEPANRRPEDPPLWNDLFNSARAEDWPAWLLVTSIARFLASGTRDRINLLAGQTAVLRNDRDTMPAEYRLFSPRDGEPIRVVASDNSVRYKFTDRPGTYRLKGQHDGPVLRGFSVNLPPGVTDLQRIDADQVANILGEDRYQLARRREELQRQQGTARLGLEFYPILALLMSLLLALELVMSNRFYRS